MAPGSICRFFRRRKILVLAALALLPAALMAATTYPRWSGSLTGIADWNGIQFSTMYPFPMQLQMGGGAVTPTNPLPTAGAWDSGYAGQLASYSGIGGLGPYGGMNATPSSPVILGSVRNTGTKVLKIRQFTLWASVAVGYSIVQQRILGVRKVTGYTAPDTGGTDVSAYFGSPKNVGGAALTGVEVLVAGVPGTPTSTGMTAGTRTPLNVSLQLPFTITLGTYGEQTPVRTAMTEPLEVGPGEGVELVLLLSTADATGYMSFIAQFDFTVEAN